MNFCNGEVNSKNFSNWQKQIIQKHPIIQNNTKIQHTYIEIQYSYTKKKFNNEMVYMYMCMCAYVLKKEFQQYAEKVSQKY